MAIGTTTALLGSAVLGLGGNILKGIMDKKATDRAADVQTLGALQQYELMNKGFGLQKEGLDFAKDIYGKDRQFLQKQYGQDRALLSQMFNKNYKFTGQQYAQARKDVAPWLGAGKSALKQYQAMMGKSIAKPKLDAASFRATPGYQFAVTEGEKGVTGNLSALGMKNSGAALKALTKFRTGIADQTYGAFADRAQRNYETELGVHNTKLDRYANLAGVGGDVANATAANRTGMAATLGTLGSNYASGVSNLGSNLSSGIAGLGQNVTGNVNNSLSGLSSTLGQMGGALQDAAAYRGSGYIGGANALGGALTGGLNTIGNTLGQMSYRPWGGGGGIY